MNPLRHGLPLLALSLVTFQASAQGAAPPAAPPPAPPGDTSGTPTAPPPATDETPSYPTPGKDTNGWDVVVTVDNRVLYVRVLRQEAGSYVTFLNSDKREETLAWSQVKVVALVPNHPSTAPIPPAAPGPAGAGSTTQTAGQVDPRAGTAQFQASRDCANSADERCREQGGMNVDGQGVALGMSGSLALKRRLAHTLVSPSKWQACMAPARATSSM